MLYFIFASTKVLSLCSLYTFLLYSATCLLPGFVGHSKWLGERHSPSLFCYKISIQIVFDSGWREAYRYMLFEAHLFCLNLRRLCLSFWRLFSHTHLLMNKIVLKLLCDKHVFFMTVVLKHIEQDISGLVEEVQRIALSLRHCETAWGSVGVGLYRVPWICLKSMKVQFQVDH